MCCSADGDQIVAIQVIRALAVMTPLGDEQLGPRSSYHREAAMVYAPRMGQLSRIITL
jgi:hypothetical protein